MHYLTNAEFYVVCMQHKHFYEIFQSIISTFRRSVGCQVGPYREMVDERTWYFLNPAVASAEDYKRVTVMPFLHADLNLVVPEPAQSLEPSAVGALGTRMLHQSGNVC